MSKAENKILKGAKEALRVAQGDIDTIKNIKVTSSCGCVFCDIGLEPEPDGYHKGKDFSILCPFAE